MTVRLRTDDRGRDRMDATPPSKPTPPDPSPAAGGPSGRHTFLRRAAAACVAGAGVGLPWSWASRRLEVTRPGRTLGLARPLRVAVLADLHLAGRPDDYQALVGRVAEARPDLAVFAGDTITSDRGLRLVRAFEELRPPLGKLAVLGNWEYMTGHGRRRLEAAFETAGIRLLVDERVELAEHGLALVGLDDWREGHPRVELAGRATEDGPCLAVSHCPGFFDPLVAEAPGPARQRLLVVSGHTHGGQIAPFGWAPVTPPGSGPYVAGWYGRDGASLYVSRGIGYSGVPVRLGANPELVLLDLA